MSSKFDLVEKQLSLVIIGGFHQLNFTNDWLKHNQLINDEDHRASDTQLHSALHIETILPWSNIQLVPYDREKNRLTLTLTDEAMFSQFMDLTNSICDMFATTNVTAMGINFSFTTQHIDQEAWDEFGHRILPPLPFSSSFEADRCRMGMNNASIKIERFLDLAVPLEDGDERFSELNVMVKPLYNDRNGARLYCSSEVALNYHFPIGNNSGMEAVYFTLEAYLDELNEKVDDQVMKFVKGE